MQKKHVWISGVVLFAALAMMTGVGAGERGGGGGGGGGRGGPPPGGGPGGGGGQGEGPRRPPPPRRNPVDFILQHATDLKLTADQIAQLEKLQKEIAANPPPPPRDGPGNRPPPREGAEGQPPPPKEGAAADGEKKGPPPPPKDGERNGPPPGGGPREKIAQILTPEQLEALKALREKAGDQPPPPPPGGPNRGR